MARTALLLVNPSAGGGRAKRKANLVFDYLVKSGWSVELDESSDLADLQNKVRSCNQEVLVLLAGDGSLRAAAEELVRHQKPTLLAPLPAGRGNDFCSALGISKNLNQALLNLCTSAEVVAIDVLSINKDLVALGSISIGLDATAGAIAHSLQMSKTLKSKLLKGAPLYVYAALKALRSWQTAPVQVSVDEGAFEDLGIWLYVVSNSGIFGGGMKISPNSGLTDGVFEIIQVGEVSKFDFLKTLPKVFKGTHLTHPKLSMRTAYKLEISSSKNLSVFADGDPIADLPISIGILNSALKVLK
jgi:YegS/Rv2252/BmrU family lipid kinase